MYLLYALYSESLSIAMKSISEVYSVLFIDEIMLPNIHHTEMQNLFQERSDEQYNGVLFLVNCFCY